VETMAEHLCALSADPSLRVRLGAAGRERIKARFTWPQERRALLELLATDENARTLAVGGAE